MLKVYKAIFLSFIILTITACDVAIEKGGLLVVKQNLQDVCGDDDPECVAAVEAQFFDCHNQHLKEWKAYYNASASKENQYLDAYFDQLYSCIKYEDGSQIFVNTPD